jgi:O-acetyl-ADP-ribose deacetylase (regulator of RNase III)
VDIRAWRGDITTLPVDAIVNAANEQLLRGSGVCGAIFRAAGPQLDTACAAVGGCATGDAVATLGFNLPAHWVIHTVGPVWYGGGQGEPAALASCYRRVVEVAARVGARTVAIPAISTGVFGYPADEAARTAVDSLRAAAADPPPGGAIEEVTLVAFDDDTALRYESLLAIR